MDCRSQEEEEDGSLWGSWGRRRWLRRTAS
jgi:hypothetical protein